MNRRRFLLRAGLLVLVLAFPAIVRAQRSPFSNPASVGAMTRKPVVASGPNTYYYTTQSDASNSSWSPGNLAYSTITFAQGGTLTKLGLHTYTTFSGTGLKMALFSDLNTIVASGTVALTDTTATPTWFDVTGLNVPVTAGTYYIVFDYESSSQRIMLLNGQPDNSTKYDPLAYASFPPASLPAGTGGTFIVGMRAFVQ